MKRLEPCAGPLLAALLALGCADADSLPGVPLAKGFGRSISFDPGLRSASFFVDLVHPDDRAVPEDVYAGDLYLAALGAQPSARKVGSGVPTLPGATAFSSEGALAFLSSWRFRTGEGELWVVEPGKDPRRVAENVTAFAWAPKGPGLAWVSGGKLQVAGVARPLSLDSVQTFAWSPDATHLAARARALFGGKLSLLDLASGELREVAKASTDVTFASDGALAFLGPAGPKGGDRELSLVDPGGQAKVIARATSFGFAPDGQTLALLSTERSPGDAYGELIRLSRGGAPLSLGTKVGEWRFSSTGDLAFIGGYDTRTRAGTLWFAPKGGPAQQISPRVQSFQFAPDGARLLFLGHKALKEDFKLELHSLDLPAKAPARKIDEGVYGYLLSPDGRTLFWKAKCQSLRSCTLFRAAADGSNEPIALATNVAGFELSPDGKRLLLAQPRRRAAKAVDLAVLDAAAAPPENPPRPFAEEVEPGARFADAAGKTVLAASLSAKSPKVGLVEAR